MDAGDRVAVGAVGEGVDGAGVGVDQGLCLTGAKVAIVMNQMMTTTAMNQMMTTTAMNQKKTTTLGDVGDIGMIQEKTTILGETEGDMEMNQKKTTTLWDVGDIGMMNSDWVTSLF